MCGPAFENGRETELGLLVRLPHNRWVFAYTPEEDFDEPIFKFSSHVFAPGAYVSVTEHHGVQRTFRVVSVTDWHPGSVPGAHRETASR